jgi:hypothetical protein
MRNVTARSTDAAEPAATTAAPGRARADDPDPPRPAHAVQRRAATGSTPPAPTVSFAELATAFDFGAPIVQGVQRRDDGAASGGDVGTIAAAGVASASAPLPHADAIQRAFGRHDVGHVRAQVGGAGAAASAAIGATAYATGDRVAFATAPDLHLAAHEAAHVVQQRGGEQLAGGVGAAGERHERHADRVADLVVAGRSAEAALDALAGGGGGATAVQRHDSPTHVRTGDSVPGEGVTLTDAATGETLTFSPGELSALVDYVGFCDGLQQRFTWEQLQKMKYLLENGIEDVLPWEDATGGLYAKEAQANEKHFAPSPGDGGANFRSNFINHYGRALMYGQGGNAEQARLALYTAEHYLQDAFSAGHQLAAKDVESAVQAQIGWFGTAKAAGRSPIGCGRKRRPDPALRLRHQPEDRHAAHADAVQGHRYRRRAAQGLGRLRRRGPAVGARGPGRDRRRGHVEAHPSRSRSRATTTSPRIRSVSSACRPRWPRCGPRSTRSPARPSSPRRWPPSCSTSTARSRRRPAAPPSAT